MLGSPPRVFACLLACLACTSSSTSPLADGGDAGSDRTPALADANDGSADAAPTSGDGGPSCLPAALVTNGLRPTWAYALGHGSAGGLVMDAHGDLIASGTFTDVLRVDGQDHASPDRHAYVMKLDRAGHLLWQRTFSNGTIAGVGVDRDANIYLAMSVGSFASPGDLGLGPVTGSLVIGKLSPDGRTLWNQGFAVFGDEHESISSAMDLAVSSTGTVAVMSTSLNGNGFVIALDTGGNMAFRKSFESDGGAAQVAFDADEHLFMAGRFEGSLNLDGSTLSAAQASAFVARLDPAGRLEWARLLGDYTRVTALATRAGRLYLAGQFGGNLALVDPPSRAQGIADLFIAAVDAVGNTAWVSTFRGAYDSVEGIATDATGGLWLAGTIADYIDLGTGLLPPTGLLLAHLDQNGKTTSAGSFTDLLGATGQRMVVDETGSLTLMGGFEVELDLGTGPLTGLKSYEPTSFLVRYAPGGSAAGVTICPSPGSPPPPAGALLSSPDSGREPTALAVDGDQIFWVTATEVMTARLGDGTPRVLAFGQKGATKLAVDASNVYWATVGTGPSSGPGHDGGIFSMPRTGGAPLALAANQNAPLAIAVDGGNVYWTAGGYDGPGVAPSGQVLSVPATGGTPRIWATALIGPGALAVAGGHVVFATVSAAPNGAVDILEASTDGTPTRTLVTTDRRVTALALDGETVFWADGNSPTVDVSTDDGRIRAVPLAGGPARTLASPQPQPFGLTVRGAQLLWATAGGFFNAQTRNTAGVWQMPKAGGTPTALLSGRAGISAFAADANHFARVETTDPSTAAWALFVTPPSGP
jgi:hypothetical protein